MRVSFGFAAASLFLITLFEFFPSIYASAGRDTSNIIRGIRSRDLNILSARQDPGVPTTGSSQSPAVEDQGDRAEVGPQDESSPNNDNNPLASQNQTVANKTGEDSSNSQQDLSLNVTQQDSSLNKTQQVSSLNKTQQDSSSNNTQQDSSFNNTHQSAVLETPLLEISVNVGLAGTIVNFCSAQKGGAKLPTKEDVTHAIGKALAQSNLPDRAQTAQKMKDSLNTLQDHMVSEVLPDPSDANGSSKTEKPNEEQKSNKELSKDAIEKVSAAMLETITFFCSRKDSASKLPTSAEMKQVLEQALQKADFKDKTQSEQEVKAALDFLTEYRAREDGNPQQVAPK